MKHETPLFTPVIINSAFSLEIYLKCLIMIEIGSRPVRGLTLIELFNGLSKESKTAIEQYFNESIARDPGVQVMVNSKENEIKFDLSSILNEISNAFLDWRSAYEPFPGKIFYGVGPLFYAVNRRIRQLKPEWTDEVVISAI
ncbi:MAG: hypothetical protein ACYC21_05895 [Eubacteriales bacterium]